MGEKEKVMPGERKMQTRHHFFMGGKEKVMPGERKMQTRHHFFIRVKNSEGKSDATEGEVASVALKSKNMS